MSLSWSFSLTPCKTVLMQQSIVHPSSSDSFSLSFPFQSKLNLTIPSQNKNQKWRTRIFSPPLILCCSEATTTKLSSSTTATNSTVVISTSNSSNAAPPVIRKTKRKRYRKQYPGESIGITEEMRFVAMRLRNLNGKKYPASVITNSDTENSQDSSNDDDEVEEDKSKEDDGLSIDTSDNDTDGDTWKPSMEGFVKFFVDNQLVFNTVERIVDESNDVAYAYFRKTGLERSEGLAKDLEWFSEQDIVIPEASTPGVSYAMYLEELAEKSAPLFLSHFYNIYFSHIAGGQVIARQASEKILEGREMEFCRWEGDAQELLKGVREKLNMLGEHWSRDEKNKCLKEAAKSFKFLGQIVRTAYSSFGPTQQLPYVGLLIEYSGLRSIDGAVKRSATLQREQIQSDLQVTYALGGSSAWEVVDISPCYSTNIF